jgi:hypothetical protein
MRDKSPISDEEIVEQLRKHPKLRDRFASLLSVVNNSQGDLKRADDAEDAVVEEMRRLGNEAMHIWAESEVAATEDETRRMNGVHREGKKNSAGTRSSGTSRS